MWMWRIACQCFVLTAAVGDVTWYGVEKEAVSAEQCNREAGLCTPTFYGPILVVVPPIQVGHVEELHIDPKRTLYRKTLSLKPALFEIGDFLTPAECQHIKRVAVQSGLQPSKTHHNNGLGGPVRIMDMNGDKRLDVGEMRLTLESSFDVYFSDADVHQMYKELKLDRDKDGILTPAELGHVDALLMRQWLGQYIDANPTTQSRLSQQVWLYADRIRRDPVLRTIQDRVAALTGLSLGIVTHSDVQVVNYAENGHYHAHWDSSHYEPSSPCCSPTIKHRCRICRFLTVMFYLNDVEQGGDTAFPVADNATLDTTKLRREHLINLREHCHDANLVVAPSGGKAVMWYNHELNSATRWMGAMDEFSWHGGCPVRRGEKWIANFWVKTTEDRDADIKRMDL